MKDHAIQAPSVLDPKHAPTRAPWGMMVHTTGSGVTSLARKEAMAEAKRAQAAGVDPRPTRSPCDVALDVYRSSQKKKRRDGKSYVFGGPGYVVDYDGTIWRMAPDTANTAHCGGKDRSRYLSGAWAKVDGMTATVAAWWKQWSTRSNPYSLFPSTSPNVDYIGVEMVPIGDGFGGDPMAPGLRFTRAQHDAVITLGRYLREAHAWPLVWAGTGRLVGHEDIQPLNRHDKRGGWDPGYLRAAPYFDFAYVRKALGGAP